MRRREFIMLCATAAAWPAKSMAQRSRNARRVGILWHAGSAEEEGVYLTALLQGLKEHGYNDGETIKLEHRFPNEEPARFASFAAELVAREVDVLIAVTRPAAVAAQRATATVPIVFILVPDPVGTKLVASLARPGGNITGFTQIAVELSGKRLQYFKQAFPGSSRVALLVNANDQLGMRRYIEEFGVASRAIGLTIEPVEVRSQADFESAFDKIATERLEGVTLPADGLFYQGRSMLARLALERRLPLVVYSRETLEAGALISYGPDQQAIFRSVAVYVDKILKGEKAANLPVQQPTKFELLVNLKTAQALGVTMPSLLLLQADEVIE